MKYASLLLIIMIITGCTDNTVRDCKQMNYKGMVISVQGDMECSNGLSAERGTVITRNQERNIMPSIYKVQYYYLEFKDVKSGIE